MTTAEQLIDKHARRTRLADGDPFIRDHVMRLIVDADYRFQWASERNARRDLKAAIAAGTTIDPTWASSLIQVPSAAPTLNLIRPRTLLGRIPFRRVPFNAPVNRQTAGGVYAFVGQGAPKPVGALAYNRTTLPSRTVAGIVVIAEELARMSGGTAENEVRRELVDGSTQFIDLKFIDPTSTGVADVEPASITAAVTPIPATGVASDDLRILLTAMHAGLDTLEGVAIIMSDSVAFAIATQVTSGGSPMFPGLGVAGGDVWGVPVFTTNAATSNVIAVHVPSIIIAEGNEIDVDTSKVTSLQMDNEPSAGAQSMVSMFQTNSVALRVSRDINWEVPRTDAVRYLSGADYGGFLS